MASIRKRVSKKDGSVSYHVQVRLKGQSQQIKRKFCAYLSDRLNRFGMELEQKAPGAFPEPPPWSSFDAAKDMQ